MADGKRHRPWPFGHQERPVHPQQRSYYQLLGLYDSLPASVLTSPDSEGPVRAFTEAKSSAWTKVDPKAEGQLPGSIASDLHRMELALVRLLPTEELIPRLGIYRDEFRNLCGEDVYSAYLESHGYARCEAAYDKPEDSRFVRADAVFLLGQVQRYNGLHERSEEARSFLLRQLARYTMAVVVVLLAPIVLFFIDRHTGLYLHYFAGVRPPNAAPQDVGRLALFSFAGLAGALGAFVSALQRIQKLSASRELARHVIVLRCSAAQLKWAPIAGVISSGVFVMLVTSGLLLGDLFPARGDPAGWTQMLYNHSEFAKLMVWCFVAGFSERLVPDLLDRLLAKAPRGSEAGAPAPSTALAAGGPAAARGAGAAGGARTLVGKGIPVRGAEEPS